MPLYAYECQPCGVKFDKIRPMKEAGDRCPCPNCGRQAAKDFNVAVGLVTDTAIFTGDKLGGIGKAPPFVRERYDRLASAAGIVTSGKQYMPELADFPGDPRAYVDSRADMKRLALERNYTIESDHVNVKAEAMAPPVEGLDVKIARSHARRIQRENPGLTAEKALDLAVERHAPPRAKRLVESPKRRVGGKPKKR